MVLFLSIANAGSQLSFLFAMISDLFEVTDDHDWLRNAIGYAEKELSGYWLNPQHLSHYGLSRFHALPHFPETAIPAITLDHEATWDLSPRFELDDVLNLLPVDLSCNFFVYERDLAFWHDALGNVEAKACWAEEANNRRQTICDLMWNNEDGLVHDYHFARGRQKTVKSLAAYFPMYAGVADEYQANRLRENLPLLEKNYDSSRATVIMAIENDNGTIQ
jgi:alpha,alpha-trehalase